LAFDLFPFVVALTIWCGWIYWMGNFGSRKRKTRSHDSMVE